MPPAKAVDAIVKYCGGGSGGGGDGGSGSGGRGGSGVVKCKVYTFVKYRFFLHF